MDKKLYDMITLFENDNNPIYFIKINSLLNKHLNDNNFYILLNTVRNILYCKSIKSNLKTNLEKYNSILNELILNLKKILNMHLILTDINLIGKYFLLINENIINMKQFVKLECYNELSKSICILLNNSIHNWFVNIDSNTETIQPHPFTNINTESQSFIEINENNLSNNYEIYDVINKMLQNPEKFTKNQLTSNYPNNNDCLIFTTNAKITSIEQPYEKFNTEYYKTSFNNRGGEGNINIPTNAPRRSPIQYGNLPKAENFSMMMYRFEELGVQELDIDNEYEHIDMPTFEQNVIGQDIPKSVEIDNVIGNNLSPSPKEEVEKSDSNNFEINPWYKEISKLLQDPIFKGKHNGRCKGYGVRKDKSLQPSGIHQRWSEFKPCKQAHACITGARMNTGIRDKYQRHKYTLGEFGPGGLYHNTTGLPGFEGTTKNIPVKFHSLFPLQQHDSLWTYDGTFPPKLLCVKYSESMIFRLHNFLPIDASRNNGFGTHTISTHEHNGHTPWVSDGYANSYFFPGEYYDNHWPLILAGHDTINIDKTDKRASIPDEKGGLINIRGDWKETMSSHWFHDHMLDSTAKNVYKGMVGVMNYYSGLDRGNESIEDGVNLRFPSGTALDWGNRDYDVNLVISGKAWGNDIQSTLEYPLTREGINMNNTDEGQLWMNPIDTDGFLGDRMTVNFCYNPYFDVRARRYRFRLLNGSVARYMKIAVVHENGETVPFHMIANDGNIMEHAIKFDGTRQTLHGILPTQAIGERYDIIIDFSKYNVGDKLYLVNIMEHDNGRKPKKLDLRKAHSFLTDIMTGKYDPDMDGNDPCVGKFLEFRVHGYNGIDLSIDPYEYEIGRKKMVEINKYSEEDLKNAIVRQFKFVRGGKGMDGGNVDWAIKYISSNTNAYGMDPHRLTSASIKNKPFNQGGLEIWRISSSGGWIHPIHIHFEEGQIISRDGETPPIWEQGARKDIYRIGANDPDTGDEIDLIIKFREFTGSYMMHCHTTTHEDHAMLLRFDIKDTNNNFLTPIPSWNNVRLEDTFPLPTYETGESIESTKSIISGIINKLRNNSFNKHSSVIKVIELS